MLRGSSRIDAVLVLKGKQMVSEHEAGKDRMGLITLKNGLMQKITLSRRKVHRRKTVERA